MKINKFKLIIFIFAALSAEAHAAEGVSLSAAQIESLGIATATVSRAGQSGTHGLPARAILPNNQIFMVSSPLSGYIARMGAAIGDRVKKGEALAWLESPSLAESERAYLETLTRFQLASEVLKRDQKLFELGIISQSRHSATRSRYVEAKAALSGQKQMLALAGLSGSAIKLLGEKGEIGSNLPIRSPVDGYVLEQTGLAGQRVEASAPIYRLAKLSPIWLDIQVPAALLSQLKLGDKVVVPSLHAEGTLSMIGKSVDQASQTVMARALMTRNIDFLKPGLQVEARISGASENLLQVPNEAIVRLDGKPAVFVRTATGFQAQRIEIVSDYDGYALVKGLGGKENIAVRGVATIKSALPGSE